jgi:hypothetical protein
MSIRKVFITQDNHYELTVEKKLFYSLVIQDDEMDATSKSCRLIFDGPTIRAIAKEIMEKCETDILQTKQKS